MQKFFFLAKKRAFTLVEMLIVIVIIWLLASALLPKIAGMQSKARDTVRKADIQSVATALQQYNMDNGSYPQTAQTVKDLGSWDLAVYLTKVPKDPKADREFDGMADISKTATRWTYAYTPIKKNGMNAAGFLLMAGTEEPGASSNWIYDSTVTTPAWLAGWKVWSGTSVEELKAVWCESVRVGTTTQLGSGGTCSIKKWETSDVLRYVLYQ